MGVATKANERAKLGRLCREYEQQIGEITELLTQLRLKAEYMRSKDGAKDMVTELVSRLQGLEAMLAEGEVAGFR